MDDAISSPESNLAFIFVRLLSKRDHLMYVIGQCKSLGPSLKKGSDGPGVCFIGKVVKFFHI